MNTLFLGLTLFVTVLVALALGIYVGYMLISAILHLMGNRSEPAPETTILVTSEAHGGD